MTLGWC